MPLYDWDVPTMNDIDRQKQRAALVSVAVKVFLTLCKFVAALLSGSLALLSEAGNNLGDVGVTLMSYFAIRVAAKPADDDHQFGHGKVEALSALIQTGFLIALAVFILIEGIKRLYGGGGDVEPGIFSFGVLVLSIVVDAWRWVSLNRIAKATKSDALAADALNFASDIVASVLALCGLITTHFGFPIGDAIAALGVAVFVAVAGLRLGSQTVATLIDAAPKGLSEPIRTVVEGIAGVIDVEQLRLRPIGSEILGDVGITVSRTLTLERVAEIKDKVVAAVARAHPEVAITVSTKPIALDDETIVERVLLIANRRHVPIHHVTVQSLDDRKSVSFDAEIDGRMTLGHAHEIVTALEVAIADDLGAGFEVESHIEPLEVGELDGRDSDEPTRALVKAALLRRAPECGTIFDVHNVRVRETSAGLVVNYHCLVDPGLSVDAVHARVDMLDRQVRADCAGVVRIVGHAEPQRARDHD
jgi:cation diffusion facilitator family transporter